MQHSALDERGTRTLADFGLDSKTLSGCRRFRAAPGETVFRQGMVLDCLYLLEKGRAKVCVSAQNGKNLIVCFYQSDGILGDAELMTGRREASATVIALTPLQLVGVPLDRNLDALLGNVRFLNKLGRNLSEKLLRSSDAHADAALRSGRERLCVYIRNNAHNGLFTDVLNDAAQSAGMSYRHLFRVLHALCAEGVLQRTPLGYRVLDPGRLAGIAEK